MERKINFVKLRDKCCYRYDDFECAHKKNKWKDCLKVHCPIWKGLEVIE